MVATQRRARDWSFSRRPGWVFSHLFVGLSIAGMLWAATWQWSRHQERVDLNAVVQERATAEPLGLAAALSEVGDGLSTDEVGDALDFRAVAVGIEWVDPEFVRVANRSQNGEAGDWLVGLAETDDGDLLLVNRGFIRRELDADPTQGSDLAGWLRATERRGSFGPVDTGEGRAPRLDVDALAERAEAAGYEEAVVPVWLQLDTPTSGGYPLPVPLPPADDGPHLGYVGQWLIFAVLTSVFYGLTLRKFATEAARSEG